MNKTDIVILFLSLFFFYSGWRSGLFRTIIGPLSILICTIAAVIYYDLNRNIVISMLIACFGGIALSIIIRIIFLLMRIGVDKSYRDSTFIGSRLLGGVLSLLWKGSLSTAILLLLTFLPAFIPGVPRMQTDIKNSRTYAFVQNNVLKKLPKTKDLVETIATFQDPDRIQKYSATPEYQAFFSDKKIQELTADPTINNLLNNKDYTRLLSNPKIIELLQDDELMGKLTRLSKMIYLEGAAGEMPPQQQDKK